MAKRQRGRDAKTGEFISVEEAKRRKNTAIVETVKPPAKPKPKPKPKPKKP
jgi:hypothetical protein